MEKMFEFLKISGVAGVFAYIINIIFKNLVESKYSRDLEKVKTDLAIIKENQSYRFNKLHDKRFSIFEELFKLLNQYYYDLHLFALPAILTTDENPYKKQRIERFEQCNKSKNNFILFYLNNTIYFDEILINKIDNFKQLTDEIFDVNYKYLFMEHNMEKFYQTKKDLLEYSTPAFKSFDRIETEVKKLLKDIETILRLQLSYESPKK